MPFIVTEVGNWRTAGVVWFVEGGKTEGGGGYGGHFAQRWVKTKQIGQDVEG